LLNNPNESVPSSFVILTGFATSISMLISGISGSYLSERAERSKDEKELERAMGMLEEDESLLEGDDSKEEIQKAMVIPVNPSDYGVKRKTFFKSKKEKKKIKTLHEKAENFSVIIISISNGVSPFLGGLVPIIPFLFVKEAVFVCFFISFIIVFVCIILLGIFLGVVSEESIPKNILEMLVAFTLTIIVIILFLR
jgi:VIT1/CCC1 family predicted Fe2+/Mn2+ transporter